VKVININKGRNKAIVEKCKTLAQYSAFIAKILYYEKKKFPLEESIKKAAKYCRSHDILKEFLEEHAKEMMNMLITEWNWDDAKEVWKEEGREEGREEIVRNALAEGFPIEMIEKITGLAPEAIENIKFFISIRLIRAIR
jgi:predicted transposase YdaD